MFTKNDIARGVVIGVLILFFIPGFYAAAYSTGSAGVPNDIASSSASTLKNISLPSFYLPSLGSVSNALTASGSFGFWTFFDLQGFSGWINAQGGFQGVIVYVLNVFLVVIQVLGQIVRAVLGYLK